MEGWGGGVAAVFMVVVVVGGDKIESVLFTETS